MKKIFLGLSLVLGTLHYAEPVFYVPNKYEQTDTNALIQELYREGRYYERNKEYKLAQKKYLNAYIVAKRAYEITDFPSYRTKMANTYMAYLYVLFANMQCEDYYRMYRYDIIKYSNNKDNILVIQGLYEGCKDNLKKKKKL